MRTTWTPWLGIAAGVALLLVPLLPSRGHSSEVAPTWIFPVRFHFPWRAGGGPIDEDDLAAELERANAIFASAGIAFAPSRPAIRIDGTAPRSALDRDDRDALVRLAEGAEVHVFVVEELLDVDEPGRRRMGVHWRLRGGASRHAVILASYAPPTVLAHELGHYFGNPHVAEPDDLMSYARTGTRPPFLSAREARRARATARRLVARGELLPLSPRPGPDRRRRSAPGSNR